VPKNGNDKGPTGDILKSGIVVDIVEKSAENEREIISHVSSSLSLPPVSVIIENYTTFLFFRCCS
jgi:hypothetical protein